MTRDTRGRAARCQGRVWLLCAVVAVAFALSATSGDAFERRKEIDFDALEKAWEADDAAQELKTEADEQYDKLNAASGVEAKTLGPQMVFVTLNTQEPLAELASRWKEMLWNGRVDANIYELEAAKVLVGIQKGAYIRELRAFLNSQDEVIVYEWNSRTYTKDEPLDDDAAAVAAKVTKKKKKSKMSKTKAKSKTTTRKQQAKHDEV